MNLHAMQRDFRRWLTTADAPAAQRLAGADRAGLDVYQNNYRVQLVGCLETTYSHLRTFIGDAAFHHAAIHHVTRHPPRAWTLDAYGAGFERTLRVLWPDNPALHELAWLEWALATAFVARDTAPLDPARLAAVDWDRARLDFAPSLHLARLTTNAADIWSALHAGAVGPDAAPAAALLPKPMGVAVWRRGFVARLRVLDPLAYDALVLARAERNLAAPCAVLVERLGADAGVAQAGALLADWIGSELLARVRATHQPRKDKP
ncbi:MAG: putative DNA-binding domain-containing protein [Massilia sp.]|nr:putative DNA-binding domain-containing protein [Massilia sp.]